VPLSDSEELPTYKTVANKNVLNTLTAEVFIVNTRQRTAANGSSPQPLAAGARSREWQPDNNSSTVQLKLFES